MQLQLLRHQRQRLPVKQLGFRQPSLALLQHPQVRARAHVLGLRQQHLQKTNLRSGQIAISQIAITVEIERLRRSGRHYYDRQQGDRQHNT